MKFPMSTAGEFDLDGTKVWMQTLNRMHRHDASHAARMSAYKCQEAWGPTGELRSQLVLTSAAMSLDDLASFVATGTVLDRGIKAEAFEAHPDPDEPEMAPGDNADKYQLKIEEYRSICKEMMEKRAAFIDEAIATETEKCKALTHQALSDRAAQIKYNSMIEQAFSRYWEPQVIYYAVRCADDHRKLFFGSPEEVEQLTDHQMSALIAFYESLDTVIPTQVPT